MKNKTLFDSIKCASKGLWFAVKTEKNFLYYTFIFSLFLILNIIFKNFIMKTKKVIRF